MNRQQKRQHEREMKDIVEKRLNQLINFGWDPDSAMQTLNKLSKTFFDDCKNVYYIKSTSDSDTFELHLREIGEDVKNNDSQLIVPRAVFVNIHKPMPYKYDYELTSTCQEILDEYSLYNVYQIMTITPDDFFYRYKLDDYFKQDFDKDDIHHAVMIAQLSLHLFLESPDKNRMRSALENALRKSTRTLAKLN